jgi:hypothetical protein
MPLKIDAEDTKYAITATITRIQCADEIVKAAHSSLARRPNMHRMADATGHLSAVFDQWFEAFNKEVEAVKRRRGP